MPPPSKPIQPSTVFTIGFMVATAICVISDEMQYRNMKKKMDEIYKDK